MPYLLSYSMEKLYPSVLIVLFLLFGSSLPAQNYTVYQSQGDESGDSWASGYHFHFDNTWLSASDNTSMSNKYELPFPWYFYGNLVTDYYISENGYITFGNSGNSIGANLTLPDAGAPNNSIFAFWDDFDWNHLISIKTYGGAPNRVHVITWYNHPFINNPSEEASFDLRIYESCADFEVRFRYNTGTNVSGTIGCQNSNGSLGTMAPGSPSISLPQLDLFDNSDDIIYVFQYDGPIDQDLAVVGLEMPNHLTNGSHTLQGAVRNRGNQAITSYDINYNINGGPVFTHTVTGVNINDNDGLATFTHSIPLNVSGAAGQQMVLKVWPSNINGFPDQRTCNDTLTKYLTNINSTSSPRNVLLEKFTGAWCGYCADGAVVMDEIIEDFPDDVIAVAIHDGDEMEFDDSLRLAFSINSFPSAIVNRKKFSTGTYEYTAEDMGRGKWYGRVSAERNAYSPASLDITHGYDPQSRMVTAIVDVEYSDYSAGDNRIVLMLVEDSLIGSGSGWDQANNYSGQVGHPYYGYGSPIPNFVHRHVLREYIDSDPFGTPGIVPKFMAPNATVTQQFEFALSSDYDSDQIYLVAALVGEVPGNDPNYFGVRGNREVINAKEVALKNVTLGLKDPTSIGLEIFPNPAHSQVQVRLSEDFRPAKQEVFITNLQGTVIKVQSIWNRNGEIDLSDLSNGMYFIGIEHKGKQYLKKLVIH